MGQAAIASWRYSPCATGRRPRVAARNGGDHHQGQAPGLSRRRRRRRGGLRKVDCNRRGPVNCCATDRFRAVERRERYDNKRDGGGCELPSMAKGSVFTADKQRKEGGGERDAQPRETRLGCWGEGAVRRLAIYGATMTKTTMKAARRQVPLWLLLMRRWRRRNFGGGPASRTDDDAATDSHWRPTQRWRCPARGTPRETRPTLTRRWGRTSQTTKVGPGSCSSAGGRGPVRADDGAAVAATATAAAPPTTTTTMPLTLTLTQRQQRSTKRTRRRRPRDGA